jgi:HSP20 family protein
MDVRETGEEYQVIAELPGVTSDDVEVTVENGVLSISGEKKEEVEEGAGTDRHLYERRYGRFQRNFSLPRSVDAENVKANFENGLLRVSLPKAAVAKPRKIKIGK